MYYTHNRLIFFCVIPTVILQQLYSFTLSATGDYTPWATFNVVRVASLKRNTSVYTNHAGLLRTSLGIAKI